MLETKNQRRLAVGEKKVPFQQIKLKKKHDDDDSIEDPEEENDQNEYNKKYLLKLKSRNKNILPHERIDTEDVLDEAIASMKETENHIIMAQIKNHEPLKKFV